MELQEKLEGIMDYMQESGLWVNMFSDVIIGPVKSVPLDAGDHTGMFFPEKGAKTYNSILLYTVATALQQPRGALIYTGGPGIGKTTVAEFASHFLLNIPLEEILDAEIHCHQELTEDKMIASFHTGKLIKDGEKVPEWNKWCDCAVHILDEGNRLATDKTNIIYNAIDRGIVHYSDFSHKLADGPIFMTMNYHDAGTSIMTPPFMDRFETSVKVPSPKAPDYEFIINRSEDLDYMNFQKAEEAVRKDMKSKLNKDAKNLSHIILTQKERDAIWKAMNSIKFNEETGNYTHYVAAQINFCLRAVSSKNSTCAPAFMTKGCCENQKPDQLCPDCRYHEGEAICKYTKNELSVRAVQSIYKYSKALAWMLGREEVTVEIVKNVIPYVARHRLEFTNSLYAANPNDPGLKNDSTACVNVMLKKIEENFQKTGELFDAYTYINKAFEKLEKKEMSADDFLKIMDHEQAMISKHDDPVKFALMGWLQKMYDNVINNCK